MSETVIKVKYWLPNRTPLKCMPVEKNHEATEKKVHKRPDNKFPSMSINVGAVVIHGTQKNHQIFALLLAVLGEICCDCKNSINIFFWVLYFYVMCTVSLGCEPMNRSYIHKWKTNVREGIFCCWTISSHLSFSHTFHFLPSFLCAFNSSHAVHVKLRNCNNKSKNHCCQPNIGTEKREKKL